MPSKANIDGQEQDSEEQKRLEEKARKIMLQAKAANTKEAKEIVKDDRYSSDEDEGAAPARPSTGRKSAKRIKSGIDSRDSRGSELTD